LEKKKLVSLSLKNKTVTKTTTTKKKIVIINIFSKIYFLKSIEILSSVRPFVSGTYLRVNKSMITIMAVKGKKT